MQTKIGEVKIIRDFFEDFKKTKREPGHGEWGIVIEEEALCKLCGEKVSGVSTDGASRSDMYFIDQDMEKHIRLHEIIACLIPQ